MASLWGDVSVVQYLVETAKADVAAKNVSERGVKGCEGCKAEEKVALPVLGRALRSC